MYVFDSGPFIILFRHYYKEQFPSLWNHFDALVAEDSIVSVREVKRELSERGDNLSEWVKEHTALFPIPTSQELKFVATIFETPHFQMLINDKQRLKKGSVADPFVIARAKISGYTLVTAEKFKPNSAKIPNVCAHFDIPCIDLQTFMKNENWTF